MRKRAIYVVRLLVFETQPSRVGGGTVERSSSTQYYAEVKAQRDSMCAISPV